MAIFRAGDIVRVYYSVPSCMQTQIKQIKNPAYGPYGKTVGHYEAKIIKVELGRLQVKNVYNEIQHYVHPKQCRLVPPANCPIDKDYGRKWSIVEPAVKQNFS